MNQWKFHNAFILEFFVVNSSISDLGILCRLRFQNLNQNVTLMGIESGLLINLLFQVQCYPNWVFA